MKIKRFKASEVEFFELKSGDVFSHNQQYFMVVSSAHASLGQNSINILDGKLCWFVPDTMVEKVSGHFVEE